MIKFEKLPDDVLSRIPRAEKTLLEDADVIFAYLFGGFARDEVNPLSDIDIAVYLRDSGNLAEHKLCLFNGLADALGTAELDLIILNTAPVSIAGRILQNRRVLVDKEPFLRHSYESVTRREFFDFKVREDAFFSRRYRVG
jgi:predicted nucleotidyltransferase